MTDEIKMNSGQAAAVPDTKTGNTEAEEKKYTDSEVDNIVRSKIARERERIKKAHDGEDREDELTKREREVLIRELKSDAREKLNEADLPHELADLMDYKDKEAFEKSYEKVTELFETAVQKASRIKIKGFVPADGAKRPPSENMDKIAEAFAPGR